MAKESKYRMSEKRREALIEELRIAQTDRSQQVAEQLKEARSFGDLSENSEYDEAKNEQAKLYGRIAELQDLIENAEIVEDTVSGNTIGIGTRVTLKDLTYDEEVFYIIVASQEADPMNNLLSDASPLGKALLGQTVGKTVTVHAPGGVEKFEILKMEKMD